MFYARWYSYITQDFCQEIAVGSEHCTKAGYPLSFLGYLTNNYQISYRMYFFIVQSEQVIASFF